MIPPKEVFIEIEIGLQYEERYFIYILEKGGKLWLTEDSKLNRSLGFRAFIRDYEVACRVAQQILDGKIV